MTVEARSLAARIDQTLLSPETGIRAASEWIEANAGCGFAALCVPPFMVPRAATLLGGTRTAVCSVVGFPLGYATTQSKAAEARELVASGCEEVDVVMNVGAFLEGDGAYVGSDLAAVVGAVVQESAGKGVTKVILETGRLEAGAIVRACEIALEAGADFVKTSTGFGPRGARVQDVQVMRQTVGDRAGVKAAGGIRDLATAMAMIDAGATRIGTSAGLAILDEASGA